MTASEPIRLIIADDHPMIRQLLKMTVKDIPDLQIIGEAANGKKAIELVKKLNPDILITDIKMPDMDGIHVTTCLTSEVPGTKVIALSMVDDEYSVIDMMEAGAKGYLLKDVFVEEVIAAVRKVYNHEIYLSKAISAKIAGMIVKGEYEAYKKQKPKFSEKEIAIMKLICMERSSKLIASEMGITKKAVDGLRDQILRKIDAKNTAGIVVYAIKNRII